MSTSPATSSSASPAKCSTRSSQRLRAAKSKPNESIDVSFEEERPRQRKRKKSGTSLAAKAKRNRSEQVSETTPPSKSENGDVAMVDGETRKTPPSKSREPKRSSDDDEDSKFVGEPFADDKARERWPKRYQGSKQKRDATKDSKDADSEIIQARRHYSQAVVDGVKYDLLDHAHVQAEEGYAYYICKIVEMFEAVDGNLYITAQWFYRAEDTVMKEHGQLIDKKRVFYSEIRDDNPLDCLVEKIVIKEVSSSVDLEAKKKISQHCHYYCDMLYLLPYSSFFNLPLPTEDETNESEASSTISNDNTNNRTKCIIEEASQRTLLDLYSGCGAMSTGLCLGANIAGLKLVTRWAVDINKYACKSLRWNHPETEVRTESAKDFLALLKEWERLCVHFSLLKSEELEKESFNPFGAEDYGDDDGSEEDVTDGEVFEVEEILAVRYGAPKLVGERVLYFKVRWKNYGLDADSWEPINGLGGCRERVKEFVTRGFNSKTLPLPGEVDVICGGPPCQGVSGLNRHRNKDPLADEKNKQLLVFMEIVEYLKPKFVLMENVVDILRFEDGFLGRYAYALSKLVHLNYQVRMGMMAAGGYGLPQFRMRVFLWGARPSEKLPQYPLPTHDVIARGVIPLQFAMNAVAYDEGQKVELQRKLLLEDAISDLPKVENTEDRDEMDYIEKPQTEFQRLIRLRKEEMPGSSRKAKPEKSLLHDHRPLRLNIDDYQRVCQIPTRKGANFRDLPGVRVRNNKVELDPNVDRVYLKSGKPLVPNYALSFIDGTSSKPFARLWWDETVATVVTRAEPHNQAILHPEQNRVLTIRENARLQGFPDYYKLFGPVKQRYIQVGNAVAVPVGRAVGYALGLAFQGLSGDEFVMELPQGFPNVGER